MTDMIQYESRIQEALAEFEKKNQIQNEVNLKKIQKSVLEVFPKIENLVSHVLKNHDESLEIIQYVLRKQKIHEESVRKTFGIVMRDLQTLEDSVKQVQNRVHNSQTFRIQETWKNCVQEIKDIITQDLAVVAPWIGCTLGLGILAWMSYSSNDPDL